MAYIFLKETPIFLYKGESLKAIDMRFEDYGLPNYNKFYIDLEKLEKNLISLQDGYLVYDKGETKVISKSIFNPKNYEDFEEYKKIPSGWTKWAEFYGQKGNIVKPAKLNAMARLGITA